MAKTVGKGQAEKSSEKIYSVGIYARLSVDFGERKSESIETQIEIVREFIKSRSDMEVYDNYIDIGRSGTDFDREDFQRMMRDVRMQKINCIVAKDLSRFGRSYIETGNYIEKIFPFMGVRFIAVTDHFDSMNLSGQSEMMSVNLKNLVNEMYARDIAAKVKAGKKARWEQGSYTGGIPPYGYRAEWTGDKRRLFVEEAAADIVKRIFDLFLSGSSRKEIVIWLYENKIARPSEYHKTGQVYCPEEEKLRQWSGESVRMILTNPVYMGCLVRERACGKDYMMRGRHDIDSGDWALKEHTHEAIVSEGLFFKAAEKFEKASACQSKNEFSKAVPVEDNIFEDVFYCGCCGSKMKRITTVKRSRSKNKIRTYSYSCPNSDRIDRFRCAGKGITLSSLTEIVREIMRQEFILSGICPEDYEKACKQESEARKKEWNGQLAALEKKLEGLMRLGSEQYLKYRMGEFDVRSFKQAKEDNDKKTAVLQKEREAVAEKFRITDLQADNKNYVWRMLMKDSGESKLTPELVRMLIERIEICQDHRIKIVFTFGKSKMLTEQRE